MKRQVNIPADGRYDAAFDVVTEAMRGGRAADWLLDQRQAAFDRFRRIGFPTTRAEAWKYTDLSELAAASFSLAVPYPLEPCALASLPLWHEDDTTFVFVDGYYAPELSTAEPDVGVDVDSLLGVCDQAPLRDVFMRTNLQMESVFASLNRALWCDGLRIRVAPRARPEKRVHVVFAHSGAQVNILVTPRLVIDIGDLAEVQLAVTHASLQDGTVLNNGVVNLDVGSGAQVEFCHTQALSETAYHVCTTRIRQQQDSALHALDVATGAALSRHDLSVSLEGPGSSVVLDGIMAARQRQVLDAHTTIEHMHPHCKSRQLYKSILDDRSSTVFNGLVRVHPGAVGTDGEQMNRNLLLSAKARANTKPELQIANDDVRCTHGATVGQISEQELFYLESRGIGPAAAREMLARGFVEEVLYRLDDTRRHADLQSLLDRYFEQTGHRGAQG